MRIPPEEFIKHEREATDPALEVMDHLYRAIVAAPEFTLRDGTKAKTEALGAPQVDDEGERGFSFDVALENGSHLEFTVKNTGWGRSLVADLSTRPGKTGRGR